MITSVLAKFSGSVAQAVTAGAGAFALLFSVYGVPQAATGIVGSGASVEQMRGEVSWTNADAAAMKIAAHQRVSADRYLSTVSGGMGGPFEAAPAAGEAGTTDAASDAQFRALFQTWKQLDTAEQTVISIPSMQPVNNMTLTSTFGVRTDPFRGVAAMHAGIDIPGPVGTPIYATADGIVGRAERAGGYGNLVELNHGKGIETRYGHLSKILVQPNTRVRRGQLIGLMGSTGRSTGSHLHYEVRVDGRAVNPTPYMQVADTMLSIQDRALKAQQVAVGGPADR
ncbi:M23 family metallopeptidase [Sphingomonas sp.]|uniref:M23 family metallopeptidase n=1 Tax=Sphingomonas sp. TaxID=28214 RepID=UPI002DD68B6D|nr:M23 family metallopeptidase [Sphingomonas sp.]